MATVYIIYSERIDHFYVGSSIDFEKRLHEHNNAKYSKSFTAKTNDWELFFKIDNLELNMAREIEQHIKRMKSRKYFENLNKYPEITQKLILKYAAPDSYRDGPRY